MAKKIVNSLRYSEENIKELEKDGYKKSSVCKPYSYGKVIRYDTERKVYWFSTSLSAYVSDCYFTQKNTKTLIII